MRVKKWGRKWMAMLLVAVILFSDHASVWAQEKAGSVNKFVDDERGCGTTDVMVEYAYLLMKNQRPQFMYQDNFGLPKEAFYQAELEGNLAVQAAQFLWDKSNFNTDSAMDIYEEVLFEIVSNQLITQEVMNCLSSEVNFDSTQYWLNAEEKKAALPVKIEDGIVEPAKNYYDFCSNVVSIGDKTVKSETIRKEIKELLKDIGLDKQDLECAKEVESVVGVLLEVSNDGQKLRERWVRLKNILELDKSVVGVLDDMYKKVNYLSDTNIFDKENLRAAITTVKRCCEDSVLIKMAYLIEEERDDVGPLLINTMVDELAKVNPYFEAAIAEWRAGMSIIEYTFAPTDMFNNMRVSYAANQFHNLLYLCWKDWKADKPEKITPLNADNAKKYVYTVWMLMDSYIVLVNNYYNYIKFPQKIQEHQMLAEFAVIYNNPLGILHYIAEYKDKKEEEKVRKKLLEKIQLLKKNCISSATTYYERAKQICERNQKEQQAATERIFKEKETKATDSLVQSYYKNCQNVVRSIPIPKSTNWTIKDAEKKESDTLDLQTSITNPVYNKNVKLTKDLEVMGNLYLQNGVLDLNGHTLTIYGNLYQSGGNLYVNNGKLIVKCNYYLREKEGVDLDGVIHYRETSGTIKMLYEKDKVEIGNNFIFHGYRCCTWKGWEAIKSLADYPDRDYSIFFRGTMTLGGDWILDSYLYAYDEFKMTLTGGHPHSIKNNYGSWGFLPNLTYQKIGNKSEKKNDNVLYWYGRFSNIKLRDNVTIYLKDTKNFAGKKYGMLTGIPQIDLNGYTMTLKGNVLWSDGNINYNKGTLHVTGDLDCHQYRGNDGDGNPSFGDALLTFYMINDQDVLDVDGNLILCLNRQFMTNQNLSGWNIVKAGIIKIGGDFIQERCFEPTGSNIVEMDGTKKQLIAVEDKINILKLNKPMSNYTINPDNCYVSLYQQYHVKFDGNGSTSGKMKILSNCAYNKVYKLTKNQFKRRGYIFTGWNTKANGSGKTYKNGAAIKNLTKKNNGTVTLYAQWKKK